MFQPFSSVHPQSFPLERNQQIILDGQTPLNSIQTDHANGTAIFEAENSPKHPTYEGRQPSSPYFPAKEVRQTNDPLNMTNTMHHRRLTAGQTTTPPPKLISAEAGKQGSINNHLNTAIHIKRTFKIKTSAATLASSPNMSRMWLF